jgi:hypothetical protein
MKFLGREPALWLAVVAAALGLLAVPDVGVLSVIQAGLWIAVVNGVVGVATAVLTRPIAPSAFTYLIGAGVALWNEYFRDVSDAFTAQANILVLAVLVLLTRDQVTPIASIDPARGLVRPPGTPQDWPQG